MVEGKYVVMKVSKTRVDTKRFRLAVPNREIRNIITEQVLALFKQNVEKDGQRP